MRNAKPVSLSANEESPEIELPAIYPPPPDLHRQDAATRQASDKPALHWDTEALKTRRRRLGVGRRDRAAPRAGAAAVPDHWPAGLLQAEREATYVQLNAHYQQPVASGPVIRR